MSRINKPTAPLVPPTSDAEVEEIVNAAIANDDTHAALVNGEVPSDQLPSYVDDVLEFADSEHFPAEGEAGKIYVALDTNYTYRWSGAAYIQVGGSSLGAGNGIAIDNNLVSVDMNYVEENLEGFQPVINDLESIRSGAAAGATAVQPAAIADDMEVIEYQDQTPITEAQLAKAVAGKLAITCNGRLYEKHYQGDAIINFHAFEIGHNISSSPRVSSIMESKEYVIMLNRNTRMLSNSGYMPVSAIGDYAGNFLEGSDEVTEEGKKLIREKDLYPVIQAISGGGSGGEAEKVIEIELEQLYNLWDANQCTIYTYTAPKSGAKGQSDADFWNGIFVDGEAPAEKWLSIQCEGLLVCRLHFESMGFNEIGAAVYSGLMYSDEEVWALHVTGEVDADTGECGVVYLSCTPIQDKLYVYNFTYGEPSFDVDDTQLVYGIRHAYMGNVIVNITDNNGNSKTLGYVDWDGDTGFVECNGGRINLYVDGKGQDDDEILADWTDYHPAPAVKTIGLMLNQNGVYDVNSESEIELSPTMTGPVAVYIMTDTDIKLYLGDIHYQPNSEDYAISIGDCGGVIATPQEKDTTLIDWSNYTPSSGGGGGSSAIQLNNAFSGMNVDFNSLVQELTTLQLTIDTTVDVIDANGVPGKISKKQYEGQKYEYVIWYEHHDFYPQYYGPRPAQIRILPISSEQSSYELIFGALVGEYYCFRGPNLYHLGKDAADVVYDQLEEAWRTYEWSKRGGIPFFYDGYATYYLDRQEEGETITFTIYPWSVEPGDADNLNSVCMPHELHQLHRTIVNDGSTITSTGDFVIGFDDMD